MPQTTDRDKYLAARQTIGECEFLFDAILWSLDQGKLDMVRNYALTGLETVKRGEKT